MRHKHSFFSRYKSIIISIGVLVLLICGSVAALFFTNDINTNKKSLMNGDTTYESIYKADYSKITAYTNIRGEDEFTLSKTENDWYIEGDDELFLNSTAVNGLIMSFGEIVGEIIEENASDVSPYGLSKPQLEIKITFADNSAETFYVGDKSASGTGCYFMHRGDANVYLVPDYKCKSFFKVANDFRDSKVINTETDKLSKIEIFNQNGDFELVKTDDVNEDKGQSNLIASQWWITEPYELYCDDAKVESEIISSLELNSENYHPDIEGEYANYGLAQPACTVTMTSSDDIQTTLYFGKQENGEVYIRVEGKKGVYSVPTGNIKILDVGVLDVASPLIIIEKIDAIKSILIEEPDGVAYEMSIEHGENAVYKINGHQVDEDSFKQTYQGIIGLAISGTVNSSVEGKEICKITYKYVENIPDKIIELHEYRDRFASITVDRRLIYYVMREQVKEMLANVKSLNEL